MPVSSASAQVRRQRFRKRFQIGRCSIVPVAEAGSGRNIEGLSARLKRAVKTRAWKASCQGTTVVQIRPLFCHPEEALGPTRNVRCDHLSGY